MKEELRTLYEFGPFHVDPEERILLREGKSVHLPTKAFDTLLVLIRNSGRLIEKSALISAIWANTFVEEGNLTVAISILRKALGDDRKKRKYIQTVEKHGYRFVGDVRKIVGSKPEFPVPVSGIRSLAVLLFRSMNSDAVHESLRLGLTDAIITKLASAGQTIVRPTRAMLNSGPPIDPLALGRELRVDAILAGQIEASPDRVRAIVDFVRVGDGSVLNSGAFEETSPNVSALADKITHGFAQSMSIRLTGESQTRPVRLRIAKSQAYQLYLEGRYFWNKRTEEGLRRSIEYFQQATTEDPHYALAYTGLADSYVLLNAFGVEPSSQAYPIAKAAVLKALDLDPLLAEAHASLGMIHFYYEWKWAEAEQAFQRAIAIDPNYVLAHSWYALNLGAAGRYDESLSQVLHAQKLDPLSLEINTVFGRISYFSRQYDRSINAYSKVIDLNPYYPRAHTRLGMTYAAVGAFEDAIREFEESQRLSGFDSSLLGLLGYSQALSGNARRAHKLRDELTHRRRHHYVPAFSVALICVGLGEHDQALQYLAKSYLEHCTDMVYAKTEPLLDPVRSDPRFIALLNQMRL
ncbi:MAG: winged helix-turn-helix domain-containing protein [Candidatus Acidiferrales bacterium]